MRTAGRLLVPGWLLAALVVLTLDGRLPAFLAWALPGTLLALGVGAVVRQQLAPSPYCRPAVPERYRMADDPRVPLAAVVATAERDAEVDPARPGDGADAAPARVGATGTLGGGGSFTVPVSQSRVVAHEHVDAR